MAAGEGWAGVVAWGIRFPDLGDAGTVGECTGAVGGPGLAETWNKKIVRMVEELDK